MKPPRFNTVLADRGARLARDGFDRRENFTMPLPAGGEAVAGVPPPAPATAADPGYGAVDAEFPRGDVLFSAPATRVAARRPGRLDEGRPLRRVALSLSEPEFVVAQLAAQAAGLSVERLAAVAIQYYAERIVKLPGLAAQRRKGGPG